MSESTSKSLLQRAQDPTTPPDRLRVLLDARDATLREAVASNPNTPPELFGELGKEFPDQILENPALELLLLEDPAFIDRLPSETRAAFAGSPRADIEMLRKFADASEPQPIRVALAKNRNTPPDVLRRLARQAVKVRKIVADHPALPADAVLDLARDQKTAVRRRIARRDELDHKAQCRLLTDADPQIRAAISARSDAPRDFLEFLQGILKYGDLIDGGVIRHDLSDDDLRRLADLQLGGWAHQQVASHPAAPPEVLLELLDSHDLETRKLIARRPELPADCLESLAKDQNLVVEVAQNRQAPAELLLRLSKDPDREIHAAVARNPSIPEEALNSLLEDDSEEVLFQARCNPAVPTEELRKWALTSSPRQRAALLNPSTPVEILLRFANKKDTSYGNNAYQRSLVAPNPALPRETMEKLARDQFPQVPQALCENPALPEDLVAWLLGHEAASVRRAAANHPNCPFDVLELLRRSCDDPELDPKQPSGNLSHDEILRLAGPGMGMRARQLAVAQPNCPVHLLEELAEGPEEAIRIFVARNQATPESILEKFIKEDNTFVQWGVAENPATPARILAQIDVDALGRDTYSENGLRQALASHPNTGEDALRKLSRRRSKDLRRLIAANPATPVDVLQRLAKSRDNETRQAAKRQLAH